MGSDFDPLESQLKPDEFSQIKMFNLTNSVSDRDKHAYKSIKIIKI